MARVNHNAIKPCLFSLWQNHLAGFHEIILGISVRYMLMCLVITHNPTPHISPVRAALSHNTAIPLVIIYTMYTSIVDDGDSGGGIMWGHVSYVHTGSSKNTQTMTCYLAFQFSVPRFWFDPVLSNTITGFIDRVYESVTEICNYCVALVG